MRIAATMLLAAALASACSKKTVPPLQLEAGRLTVTNTTNDDWNKVEIWVNQKYVVSLPKVEPNKLKIINFQMLFDEKGNYFPTDNKKVLISKVEVLKEGKMFDVPVRLGD